MSFAGVATRSLAGIAATSASTATTLKFASEDLILEIPGRHDLLYSVPGYRKLTTSEQEDQRNAQEASAETAAADALGLTVANYYLSEMFEAVC